MFIHHSVWMIERQREGGNPRRQTAEHNAHGLTQAQMKRGIGGHRADGMTWRVSALRQQSNLQDKLCAFVRSHESDLAVSSVLRIVTYSDDRNRTGQEGPVLVNPIYKRNYLSVHQINRDAIFSCNPTPAPKADFDIMMP